jgi:hypothetical protein
MIIVYSVTAIIVDHTIREVRIVCRLSFETIVNLSEIKVRAIRRAKNMRIIKSLE